MRWSSEKTVVRVAESGGSWNVNVDYDGTTICADWGSYGFGADG